MKQSGRFGSGAVNVRITLRCIRDCLASSSNTGLTVDEVAHASLVSNQICEGWLLIAAFYNMYLH